MKNKIRIIFTIFFLIGLLLPLNTTATDNISVLKVDSFINEKGAENCSLTVKAFVKNNGEADDVSLEVIAIDVGGFELATITLNGFLKQGQTKVLVANVKIPKKVYEEIVGWEWKGRFGDLDRYSD